MQITFEMDSDSQTITLDELNAFEAIIGLPLPEDYRQHMLTYNGGMVEQDNIDHVNYIGRDKGMSDFYPIKYGYDTMEDVYSLLLGKIPNGYLAIGKTLGQGEIIISLNNDATYGNTKEWYPDGTLNELSPSFTQLLNDQVEAEE